MGIKTVPHPPYSPDLAPCDFCLFPKLRGCCYEDNWGNERGCDDGHWHAHTRELPWDLPEVVETVQQVHCSQRRLLWRGLEFHVCTINKSVHTKKSLETYIMILIYQTATPNTLHDISEISQLKIKIIDWKILQYTSDLKSNCFHSSICWNYNTFKHFLWTFLFLLKLPIGFTHEKNKIKCEEINLDKPNTMINCIWIHQCPSN